MLDTPLLLGAEEAARLLGISRSSVYQLLASGDLRGVKVGRARRFSRRELDDYVERLELVAETGDVSG